MVWESAIEAAASEQPSSNAEPRAKKPKTEKRGKPQALPEEKKRALAKLDGCAHECFSQALWLQVSDSACDRAKEQTGESGDDVRRTLSEAPSGYWLVAVDVNEHMCWRKETGEVDYGVGCFIFWRAGGVHSGWYCATEPFNTDAEAADVEVFMYFGGGEGSFVPSDAHCPYWSEAINDGISVSPMLPLMAAEIRSLRLQSETLIVDLKFAYEELRASHATRKEHNKTMGQHGGYLPKVASILALWYGKRWRELSKLSDYYYNSSAILRQLTDSAMSTSNIKHLNKALGDD